MMARNRIAISVNTAAIPKAVSARLPAGAAAKILMANTMNRMKDTKKSGTAANTAAIYIDECGEVFDHKVCDDRCNGQCHEYDVQYASDCIGVHTLVI